jgi:glucose/arabinose dehydrogenase
MSSLRRFSRLAAAPTLAVVTAAYAASCTSGGSPAVPSDSYNAPPSPTTTTTTPPPQADSGPPAAKDAGVDAAKDAAKDAAHDATMHDGGQLQTFCSLPGSYVWNNGTYTVVPGTQNLPDAQAPMDLSWLNVPDGFCVHFFASVPETRNLRFAANGDLFVATPSDGCAGGAFGGLGGVAVVPDDNHDGIGDSIVMYKPNIPQVQGMMFYNGYFYFQDATTINRVPYTPGDRMAQSPSEMIANIQVYVSGDHWPKLIDVDDNGNVYVTNGGDQGDECITGETQAQQPFQGGILMIPSGPDAGGGNPAGTEIARGLRNPIALRCKRGTGTCFALELAKDFDPQGGSREKLIPVRAGDDWGFPCCATANQPYTDLLPTPPVSACASVAAETTSFIIDHTPFGLDFESGMWPGIWNKRTFVVLHGYFGSWIGARVIAIQSDPTTGWPVPSNEADAGSVFTDFATGWDDGMLDHGRPGSVAFAPDGRLFVGQDIGSGAPADPRLNGLIVWIAPVGATFLPN